MTHPTAQPTALTDQEYDALWRECGDFIRFNPGARHRRRIMIRLLKCIRFESLLDVGCGPGEMMALIHSNFPNVKQLTGADLSPETIEKNKKRLPSARFHTLNIEAQSLPEKKYDLVVCSEVIEHLENRRAAFRNLAAMVAPSGHLLVTCPVGKLYPTEKHFGHVSHPTLLEIQAHAASTGLVVTHAENWGWPTYRLLKILTNINSNWAIRKFANGSYGWPQKLISTLLYFANFLNFRSSPKGCQLFVLLRKGEN